VVRDHEFNASMFPNGLMIVHTGLLARMRSEAQLAAVLGHESGHYLRRHSVRRWRDLKVKTAIMAVVAIGAGAASGGTGNNWYDLADAINHALLLSMFQFSRDMESEADAFGIKLLADAGYAPHAASAVWSQVIGERKASATVRKKRYRDAARSVLSTHPPNDDRMSELASFARQMPSAGELRQTEWQRAIGPFRMMILAEQIGLNDAGASQYMLTSLAEEGWDGVLRYYEGESFRLRGEAGDEASAAAAYAEAVKFADAPPEAYRAHGYAQIKAGKLEDGKRALERYLEMKPEAPDAAMVRFSVGQ
jgi:predicted Zn-dependent protease